LEEEPLMKTYTFLMNFSVKPFDYSW